VAMTFAAASVAAWVSFVIILFMPERTLRGRG